MGKGLPGSHFLAKMLSRACCSTEICRGMDHVNQSVTKEQCKSWWHNSIHQLSFFQVFLHAPRGIKHRAASQGFMITAFPKLFTGQFHTA